MGRISNISRSSGLALLIGAACLGSAKSADLGAPSPQAEQSTPWIKLNVGAAGVTDLRFRGVSYSNNRPAVYAYAQAHVFDWLYGGVFASTVDFPARYGLSDPDVKLNFWGGLKHNWGNFDLEAGYMYYYYPGERPFPGARQTDYWELYANPTLQIGDSLSLAGSFNWTSDWLNTDAHAVYASITPKLSLSTIPNTALKPYISGGIGALWYRRSSYFRFPKNYVDWNVGAGVTYNNATFDVRYVDTNLSKSNCAIDDGHRTWCGATVIGKLSFDFSFK